MYGVMHVDAKDQENPDKVYANLTAVPMRHDDQTIPEDAKLITQASRNEYEAEKAQEDAPEEGTAGATEGVRDTCRGWIEHCIAMGVHTAEQGQKYSNWLNGSPQVADMEKFIKKCEADCSEKNVAFYGAKDDLPFN